MMLKMGKIVVGADAWKTRGDGCDGDFEKMLLITDEVLIAWTLDGHYNGWCDQFLRRFVKRSGKPNGRRITHAESGTSSAADTSSATSTTDDENSVAVTTGGGNLMEACKQMPSTETTDWLNYQRPLCGCWFVRGAMDAGFTSKNGGTTDQGKDRWNTWFQIILERRLSKRSDDQNLKEHHREFCKAFKDAWKVMYGGGEGKHGKGGHPGEKKKVTAFNGIMLTGV